MSSNSVPKKHLSFTSLRRAFSEHIKKMPDDRQSSKCNYTMHDVVMSAFACMYYQDPSLKQFQERLEKKLQRNNLQTLFGV